MKYLETMGLALAVLVLSAMSAAPAQADHPAIYVAPNASQVDLKTDSHIVLSLPGKVTTCKKIDGHAAYSGSTSSLTATDVQWTECNTTILGFINLSTTTTMDDECHFTFTFDTFTTASDDADGSIHICEITISQYTSASHETLYCQLHIPEQTIDDVTYTNSTFGVPTVTAHVDADIEVTVTNLGTTGCTKHENATATLVTSVWLTATQAAEEESESEISM